MGKIPPVVNNTGEMTKVLNGMKRIEKMVVAITAEWCGACQRIKKELHTILRSNQSGIPATNIDLDMLGQNSGIPAPSSVPSIGLYVNGKLVKKIEGMEELSAILKPKTSMNKTSANNASANNSSANQMSSKQTLIPDEEDEPTIESVSIQPNNAGRPASVTMEPVTPVTNSPVLPPSATNDQSPSPVPSQNASQAGGNLYGTLASTAYQLAPPAILLGIASATLGKKRRTKKAKRTRRR
jgi:thiol-disulfide isomerase/thioredoxin